MHFLHYIVFSCLVYTADPSSQVDSQQLREVLKSQQNGLHDMEFIYEGAVRLNEGQADSQDSKSPSFNFSFQGIFALREDKSIHDELYIFQNDDIEKLSNKNVICLWKNKVYESVDSPDRGVPSVSGKVTSGGISSLDRAGSPLRFLLIPNLLFSSHYYSDNNCKAMEWEVIDGRNCLRVEFTKNNIKESYWIDVERGSNPLKYELSIAGKLRMRTGRISLASVTDKSGKRFWLPVSGVRESFLKKDLTYSSNPVFVESYKVVDGSLTYFP